MTQDPEHHKAAEAQINKAKKSTFDIHLLMHVCLCCAHSSLVTRHSSSCVNLYLLTAPAFHQALMAVVLHGGRHNVDVTVRQSAGLLVKNNLRNYNQAQTETVKKFALALLHDSHHIVRNLGGTIIAYVIRRRGERIV